MGWNFTNHNQLWIWSYESYLSVTVMAHLTILSINLKCNSFWLRKLDITKITVEKYFPVLDLYFCNEEQIVVLKNRSDNSDWLAQMKCTRKHRILRILVQLLAEIGTGCFANSRGAIHTSSANAITEIVILTSTFLNFSF